MSNKKEERTKVTKVTEKIQTSSTKNTPKSVTDSKEDREEKIQKEKWKEQQENNKSTLEENKKTEEKITTETADIEEDIQQEYEITVLGNKQKYKIPYPFEITEKGEILYTVDNSTKRLSHLLVFPTAIIKNLDSGEEKLKIAVYKNGEWKEGIFLKSKAYGTPIELSNFGIPINSSNSRWFVKYLAEIEAENEGNIPVIEAVSKLGWRNGHFVPFSNDCPYVIDMDYRLEKWTNAYTEKGTLNEWKESMRPYRKNNIFRFILSSSFASVLLNPLGHRIFMIFNWGNSRAGKTAALNAALSVWGNPYNLVMTFNTTAVGVERLARII